MFYSKNSFNKGFSEKRQNSGYEFINPMLECEPDKIFGSTEFVSLEKKIREYINNALNSNKATEISYYWRDLNLGPWIGINEQKEFTPSSLLKVPNFSSFLKTS